MLEFYVKHIRNGYTTAAKTYAVAYRWIDSNEVDICKADSRTLACMYADDNIVVLSTMEL